MSHGLCDTKQLLEPFFVEADDHIILHENHRHTHLSAFLDHLLCLLFVSRNVVFGICDVVLLKECFRRFAECARWCCVDRYVFHMVCIVYTRIMITYKVPCRGARRATRTRSRVSMPEIFRLQ